MRATETAEIGWAVVWRRGNVLVTEVMEIMES